MDVARLQAPFRARAVRRRPRAWRRRAHSGGRGSLTPAEIKMAAFIEEGLSNPDITARLLPRRAVATHVSAKQDLSHQPRPWRFRFDSNRALN